MAFLFFHSSLRVLVSSRCLTSVNDAPINKLEALIRTGIPGMMNTEQSPQNFPTTKVKVLPWALTLLGLATLNNIPINNFVIE